MEWGLLGYMELIAIMGALKTMLHDQCHVTPHGKLHGQIWEYQDSIGIDRTHGATHSVGCSNP